MYRRILVALDHSKADEVLLPHIIELGTLMRAEILLVHVADGWVARNFDRLNLAESEEIREDRVYLDRTAATLRETSGLTVTTRLAMGDPPREILKLAEEEQCDLIAMTTHGHRFLADLIHGSTITAVRHKSHIPILLVRATEL